MKKTIIASLLLATSLCATGCVTPGDTKANEPATQNPELTQPAAPDTTASPETIANTDAVLGTAYTIGDWSITINSVSYNTRVADNAYYGHVAEEGSKYLVVNLTVTNNGKTANAFLNTYSFGNDVVRTKVVYKGEYEYTSTNMLGYSRDMHDDSVQPLASSTGEVIFSLPDTVVNGDDDAELIFYNQDAQVSLNIGASIVNQ